MNIQESIYTGYIWYSDQTKPEILKNKSFHLEIYDNINPFVVEAQLYDGKTSVSIKYVDGKYIFKSNDLSDLKGSYTDVSYIPNRMDGVEKLLFRQYWKPVKDELCQNWEVLQPAEQVFVGFEYSNDSKENKED